MNTDEPLIWTSKGNLPEASLTVKAVWTETADAIMFSEEHWLGDELVKKSGHVLSKTGVSGEAVANPLA